MRMFETVKKVRQEPNVIKIRESTKFKELGAFDLLEKIN